MNRPLPSLLRFLVLLLPLADGAWAQSAADLLRDRRGAGLAQPGPVTAEIGWEMQHLKPEDSRSVLRLRFHHKLPDGSTPVVAAGLLDEKSPAASDARVWQMLASDGKKLQAVRFTVEPEIDAATGHAQGVLFIPEKTPSDKLDYVALPDAKALPLVFTDPRWRLANPDPKSWKQPVRDDLKVDLAWMNGNKAIESKLELKAGESSGISLRAQYGMRDWNNGDPWRFQAILTADATWRPKERGRYINSIVGEIDFLRTTHLRFGGDDFLAAGAPAVFLKTADPAAANERRPPALVAITENGFSARIESDQRFETVQGAFGLTSWNAIHAPWIEAFGNALCLTRNRTAPVPSPIFVFAYDYVVKMHQDATGEQVTEVGEHRLRGRFLWSVNLAHDMAVPFVSDRVQSHYDLDFVIDVGGIYDLETAKFSPDTRLSLELAPMSLGDSKPSLTVTYVNGKTTPKFENYNALFGGVKLPF